MANAIAISITADIADFQVKAAMLKSELRAAEADLRRFAATANKEGATDELRQSMLAAANASVKSKNALNLVEKELRSLSAPAAEAAGAMAVVSHGSSTVVRELLVLAREAGRGNFTRMAGSATVLAGALGWMTPEVIGAGVAIAGVAAPVIAFGLAANAAADDAAKFHNAMALTGNYAGLTASDFEDMAHRVESASNSNLGAARADLLRLAASGRFTADEIEQLGTVTSKFTALTGEQSDKVVEGWVKMADGPSRYAQEFNRTYHAFSAAELEHIDQLEKDGQRTAAVAAATQDLTRWISGQTPQVDFLSNSWKNLTGNLNDVWEGMKRLVSVGTTGQQLADVDAELARMQSPDYLRAHVGGAAGARAAYEKQIFALEQKRAALYATAAAEQHASDAAAKTAAATAAATDAMADEAGFRSIAKGAALADQAVARFRRDMEAIKNAPGGAPKPGEDPVFDAWSRDPKAAEAKIRRQNDPADFKGAGARKPKSDQLAAWREELQGQLEAEKAYFGDSKAEERAFWGSKLALVQRGSEEERQVKTTLYNLDRELAQQAYRDHIAALDEKLAADRNAWSREQADMAQKVAYIKSTQGEQSAEYQAAQRQQEELERRHEETLLQIQRTGQEAALAELRIALDAQKTMRERDARTAEDAIRAKPRNSGPFGRLHADGEIAALHQRMLAQDLAANATEHAAAAPALQQGIDQARATSGEGSEAYIAAVKKKEMADQEFAAKNKLISNQMVATAKEDAQKLANDWHSVIDPMVNATVQGFEGLIMHTETWRQALMGVASSAMGMIITEIERMIAEWLVSLIVGKAATAALGQGNIKSYAATAGAAGVSSMAGAPFPLNLTAPEFGLAMEGAAMAFGSFAQGADIVPRDMIAQIHAGERIIPRANNDKLMAAVERGTGAAGAAPGAVINNHFAPTIHTTGPADFERALEDHGHVVLAMIKRAARDGKLRGLG